jgi:hypothetical protein
MNAVDGISMAKIPFFGDKSASSPGSIATIELEEQIEEKIEDGDHDRFSHYVPKDKIVESAVTGKPVRALCGKKWVPNRDPEKFPLCPVCKKIYDGLKK